MIYKIWKESGIFENAIRVGGFSSTKNIVHAAVSSTKKKN